MNFIEKKDYDASIRVEFLDAIIRNDEAVLEMTEDAAIQEMTPYLSDKYDTDIIFQAKTNDIDNRHKLILMYAKDITIYHLYSIYNPAQLTGNNNLRKDRYNRALEWLSQVRKGDIIPNGLPIKPNNNTNTIDNSIVFKSNLKRNNHF